MSKASSPNPTAEICILAGGLSSRMGCDKAKLRLGGQTLLQHIRRAAKELGCPVHVLRGDAVPRCGPLGGVYTRLTRSRAGAVLFLSCDMPFVSTELLLKVMGALPKRGLAAFVFQADLNSKVGHEGQKHAPAKPRSARFSEAPERFTGLPYDSDREESRSEDFVDLRRKPSRVQQRGAVGCPFVLRREALSVVKSLLDDGEYSLQKLAAALRAKLVRVPKPFRRELFNINTPADWKAARELWGKQPCRLRQASGPLN